MRKKTLNLSAACILCAAAWAARGGEKTVTSKEFGFEITFPETWQVDDKLDQGVYVTGFSPRVAGAQSAMQCFIYINEITEGTTLKAFADTVESDWRRRHNDDDYEFVEKVEWKNGNTSSYKVTNLYGGKNGTLRRRSAKYLFVAGKRGYIVSMTANNDDYDKVSKDIDAIVASFKLLEAK